eukprot:1182017-Amphidinium_carterae.1
MEKPKNGKRLFLKKIPLLYVLFFFPRYGLGRGGVRGDRTVCDVGTRQVETSEVELKNQATELHSKDSGSEKLPSDRSLKLRSPEPIKPPNPPPKK